MVTIAVSPRATAPQASPLPESARRLLRLKDVCALTGLKKSSIYKLIAEDRFPRQVRSPFSRVAYWDSDAVANWVAAVLTSAQRSSEPTHARSV
jgi:predicted DNA-binding transcriptional regulator AlpA